MYWTVSKAKRPTRTHHAAVTVRQSVYSFGGPCNGDAPGGGHDVYQIHVHVFDTVSLSWTKLTQAAATTTTGRGGGRRSSSSSSPKEVPSTRSGHTAVLVGNTIYIWGGIVYTGIYSTNDTYAFDVDAHRWSKVATSGAAPGARCGHSAVVVGSSMYVYGGLTINEAFEPECNSNVYRLDTAGGMLWSLVKTRGTPPPASSCHSATVIGTKMFVFGGWGDHEDYNVRAFDTRTACWLSVPPARLLPEARFGQSAFAHGGQLYIFGGCNFQRTFSDLWRFNPETSSWRKVEPSGGKGPSRMYGMCCVVVADHRVVLFGGYKGGCTAAADDLHVLDFRPALKTLCEVAVVRWRLRRSGLPHNVRWELVAMTTNSRRKNVRVVAPLAGANKRKSETTAASTLQDNKVRRVHKNTTARKTKK